MNLTSRLAGLVMVAAGCTVFGTTAHAQISKPTENELNAVPPGFNDLVHGRSKLINQKAGGPPPGSMPRMETIANPSRDPRDFSGNWAGGMGGMPSRSKTDPHPGIGYATKLDGNRICGISPAVLFTSAKVYQTAHQLTFVDGGSLRVRRFYLDGKPHGSASPSYGGRSTAHWDGDTLVIDTTNLKGVITKLDFDLETGTHMLKLVTPKLDVVTRISKSADGSTLRFDQSWTDRATGDSPYHDSTNLTLVKDAPQFDNECEIEGDVFGENYDKAVGK